MAKKAFRDFAIVKNYAKLVKTYSCDKDKDTKERTIYTQFLFGDALVTASFEFGRDKRTKRVDVVIDDIFDKYGRKRYSSATEFARAICSGLKLTYDDSHDITTVASLTKHNSFDNTISNGLSTMEALFERIKEVLGLTVENPINEDLIKQIYIDYLLKRRNFSFVVSMVGFAAFLAIVIYIIINQGMGGLLGLFLFFVMGIGFLAGVGYILAFVYYKKKHERWLKK